MFGRFLSILRWRRTPIPHRASIPNGVGPYSQVWDIGFRIARIAPVYAGVCLSAVTVALVVAAFNKPPSLTQSLIMLIVGAVKSRRG